MRKIRIVFETPKNERFFCYFEGKNRSFFEVLKTRVGVVAIFNCLDETKYERFFLQAFLNEIAENIKILLKLDKKFKMGCSLWCF